MEIYKISEFFDDFFFMIHRPVNKIFLIWIPDVFKDKNFEQQTGYFFSQMLIPGIFLLQFLKSQQQVCFMLFR